MPAVARKNRWVQCSQLSRSEVELKAGSLLLLHSKWSLRAELAGGVLSRRGMVAVGRFCLYPQLNVWATADREWKKRNGLLVLALLLLAVNLITKRRSALSCSYVGRYVLRSSIGSHGSGNVVSINTCLCRRITAVRIDVVWCWLARRERELYLPQNNTNTVMQRATKNDNVAGCQKRLSPIKLATLQNRQIRQNKQ